MVVFVLSKVKIKSNGVLRNVNPATQHSVHPTGGYAPPKWVYTWLKVGSVKAVLSRPIHQRVTQTVGRLS